MKCRKKKPAEKQNVAFFVVVVGDKNWRVVVELREEFEYVMERILVEIRKKSTFRLLHECQRLACERQNEGPINQMTLKGTFLTSIKSE